MYAFVLAAVNILYFRTSEIYDRDYKIKNTLDRPADRNIIKIMLRQWFLYDPQNRRGSLSLPAFSGIIKYRRIMTVSLLV